MKVTRYVPVEIKKILEEFLAVGRWLLAVGRWLLELREHRLFLFTIGAILTATMLAFLLGSERAFRVTGLVLQLIGIATVAFNIRGTWEQFDHPSAIALASQWLRRFPRIGSSSHVIYAEAHMAMESSATARADI
ncbi:hypothetical protein [Rhodopila sp.]|uniref:hypothetical protein n=1 Tax=Rhodopila sp. TaxID=2480087 RepID=UPI003D0FB183